MSNLAKVICFLLITGATSVSVHFSLDRAQKSFDSTLFHTEAYIKFQYNLVERKLEKSLELASSALGELTAWNHSNSDRVVPKRQCYEDYMKSCQLELKNLIKPKQAVVRLLRESKYRAKKCLSSKAKLFKNHEAAKCILKIREEYLTAYGGVSSKFDEVARKMDKKIKACKELLYLSVVV